MPPSSRLRIEIPDDLDVIVVDHPLAAARLSTMRDARTDNATFRAALRELTLMLIYEASRDAARRSGCRSTPRSPAPPPSGCSNPPLLVPVLRAGLGMADQAHSLIPEAQMGFVGLARDEETLLPTPYMESLPESLAGRPVYVLDPMLATGGSMVHTIELLIGRGATDVTAICALAAPEGLVTLAACGPAGAGGHRVRRRAAQRLGLHRARAGRRGGPPVRRRLTDPAAGVARPPKLPGLQPSRWGDTSSGRLRESNDPARGVGRRGTQSRAGGGSRT